MTGPSQSQAVLVECLVVVGTGFMGASIARAAKRRGVARQVVGVDPREAPAALNAGCLDRAVGSLGELKGLCPTAPQSVAVVVAVEQAEMVLAVVQVAAELVIPGQV